MRIEVQEIYKDKIRRILSVYPRLSPSMLHVGLGPSTPAEIWRPILQDMIESGEINETTVPVDGSSARKYRVLSLNAKAKDSTEPPVETAKA